MLFALALPLASDCLGHFPEGKHHFRPDLLENVHILTLNSKLHQACAVSTGFAMGFELLPITEIKFLVVLLVVLLLCCPNADMPKSAPELLWVCPHPFCTG